MKTLKTILCALVLMTAAMFTSKADFVLNASGTAEIQKTFAFGSNTATTATLSFNDKYIYTLISNAVANVKNWADTNIAPTNLPADGYIAYNPAANDEMVTGVFYITNKSGLYYPLSGIDTSGQYYSWIELDSLNMSAYQWPPPGLVNVRFSLGWTADESFQGTTSYKLNSKSNGTETAKSTAVFYIHDNPYSYYDAQNADVVFSNDNALEVRGILTVTIAMTSANDTISRLSMTGSGNLMYNFSFTNTATYAGGQLVKNATVKFAK